MRTTAIQPRPTLLQIGAIVPWNYPFHNVFNPLVAAVFAGNAIVIKVQILAPTCTNRCEDILYLLPCLQSCGGPAKTGMLQTFGDTCSCKVPVWAETDYLFPMF